MSALPTRRELRQMRARFLNLYTVIGVVGLAAIAIFMTLVR